MKLEIIHADTCLPDYWGGHHKAHVSIHVYKGMSLKEIKQSIRNEVNEGFVMGSDELAFLLSADYVGDKADKATRQSYAAINRMKPVIKGQRKFFMDLEEDDEQDYNVYAYFVITEV